MIVNNSWALYMLALCCCDKIPDKINLRKKDLFWLMVTEVPVQGYLAPLILNPWWNTISWWRGCARAKLLASWHSKTREERKGRGRGQDTPFQLPTRPHLLKFPPPSSSTTGWNQWAFNTWVFGEHSRSKV